MKWPMIGVLLLASVGLAADVPEPKTNLRASSIAAAPRPKNEIPVAEGGYVDHQIAVPAGASVIWRITPTPVQRSTDLPAGRLVFGGKKGTTYTATALVINFDAKTVTDTDYVFVFGGSPVVTPPPKKDPPVVTPPGPTPTVYYFLILRENGPPKVAFTKIMENAAWDTLRSQGHKVKDKTLDEATRDGWAVPGGVTLPAVMILKEGATTSEIITTVPLPTTGPTILELPSKASK